MSHIMSWSLPDELFYSSIIRDYMRSGMSLNGYNCKIFSNRKSKANPLYTARLGALVDYFGRDYHDVLMKGTVIPFFLAFFDPQYRICFHGKIANSQNVKRLLNLTNFIEKEGDFLKCCSRCMEIDHEVFGIAYWHRCHQFPGITACYKHGCLLDQIRIDQEVRGLHYVLPNPACSVIPASRNELKVSEFSDAVVSSFVNGQAHELRLVLGRRLRKSGYVNKSGSIRRIALLRDVCEFSEGLVNVHRGVLPSCKTDYKYLDRLFSSPSSQHPFKSLLILSLMFESVEELNKELCDQNGYVETPQLNSKPSGMLYNSDNSDFPGKSTIINWRLLEKHKNEVRKYIINNPSAVRQDVKINCCASYYYVYNNDRAWFEENMPNKTHPKKSGKVNWEDRDRKTAVKVERYLENCSERISIYKLDQVVTGKRWLTRYREKMPISLGVYLSYMSSL